MAETKMRLQEVTREKDELFRLLESEHAQSASRDQGVQQGQLERVNMLEQATAQLEADNKELCQKVDS